MIYRDNVVVCTNLIEWTTLCKIQIRLDVLLKIVVTEMNGG